MNFVLAGSSSPSSDPLVGTVNVPNDNIIFVWVWGRDRAALFGCGGSCIEEEFVV